MPLTIYFVRHGESQANVDRVFANRVNQPAGLTMAGIEQANALAQMLQGRSTSHVYTSPLQRAQQTAEIIASHLGVDTTTSDALREYDVGDFEGLSYHGNSAWRWDAYERTEAQWRRGIHHVRLPGGESLSDMRSRFVPFMDHLSACHSPSEAVAVVSHGGLLRIVLPILFKAITNEYALIHTLGHCEMVAAVRENEEWRCRQWGSELLDYTSI